MGRTSTAATVKIHSRIELLLLTLLLVAGFTLRVWSVNFDQGIGSHPDERSTACFVAPTIGWPQSWEEFRDPRRSPLNPMWNRAQGERRSFTYGHFPLYLGVGMGELMHRVAPTVEPIALRLGFAPETTALMERANRSCDAIAVAGRLTIAALDTATILLVYLLAVAIFPRRAGRARAPPHWIALLAAAFYAFTAQAIQLSHFFAMDPAGTTFTVLAVLGGVYMLRRRSMAAATLCGIGAGIAIASKFSALPILAIPVAAGILIYRQAAAHAVNMESPGRVLTSGFETEREVLEAAPDSAIGEAQFYALIGSAWALLVACVTFVATSPYAVLDWQNFIQATLVEQGRMVRGVADFPFTRQYRGTTPYLYFIEQQLAWGMWWPLGVTALAGSLAAVALLLRTLFTLVLDLVGRTNRPFSHVAASNVIVWAWVLPYFAITGAFLAKFNRYMSPVLPFAALFAAGLIWAILHSAQRIGAQGLKANENQQPDHEIGTRDDSVKRSVASGPWLEVLVRGIAAVVAAVALTGSVFWSAAYVNGVYGTEHTWITASRWVYEHAPRGSVILWELWDDPIPLRSMPDDPEMNLGTAGLQHIDWSPYEEDNHDKYLILRERLREADFVVYSSKRIYGSVVNLPERYPMTIRYYEGMWDGSLGFEVAVDVTTPPRLFGWEIDDRHADESWSLYDHPRVTVFRKVRELSDAEFDAYFERAWEGAIAYYRGEDSFLSPFLEVIGLGRSPGSEQAGLLGRVTRLLSGETTAPGAQEAVPDLMLDASLAELPLVDNYRWNTWASEDSWRAVLVWWGALWLLGLAVWPLLFRLFSGLRDRGYMVSRTAGWLLAGWILWVGASLPIWHNTVRNAWFVLGGLGVLGAYLVFRRRAEMFDFLRRRWPVLLVGEAVFAVAFVFFVQIRILNPDLWQPWHGGEKFMEFAFLNGVLRSPTFPPVNPHFAGGYINYYYYGLFLVAYVIKLTGIYAEIAFNLAVASLFALTALNAFAVVYNVAGPMDDRLHGRRNETQSRIGQLRVVSGWSTGLRTGLLAAVFVVGIGNLEAFAQLIRNVTRDVSINQAQGVFGFLPHLGAGIVNFVSLLGQGGPLPSYDFWGPSRVIPHTINEFPYWTFLFADLHPHMIGIPFTLLFLMGVVQMLCYAAYRPRIGRDVLLVWAVGAAFVVGGLAAINLWEYPTYLGLTLLLCLVLGLTGKISLPSGIFAWLIAAGLSYLLYLPFFQNYAGVGATGVGLVREADDFGPWFLIWGFFLFIVLGWPAWANARRPDPTLHFAGDVTGNVREMGLSRLFRLLIVYYDRIPRVIALCRKLLRRQTFGFLFGITILALLGVSLLLALFAGRWALGISLVGVLLCVPLMLRANRSGELATVFAALVAFAGFLLLAGTQIVYVRDFLQGGDWYRMNTLFKFFIQVWVFLGLAAAIGFSQLWRATAWKSRTPGKLVVQRFADVQRKSLRFADVQADEVDADYAGPPAPVSLSSRVGGLVWRAIAIGLLLAVMAYPVFGTPARLSQRMVGWRPPVGTLDGMAFMDGGSYTWPDGSHRIELRHDYDAIRWLLDNVRGNLVIAESAEVDYYRAGGTRIASFTGLSGLMGKHEGEQRSGEQVGRRHGLMREFWETSDLSRTLEIAQELEVALVYVGQLERHQHPSAVDKMEQMAEAGLLDVLYENGGSVIYAFPERIAPSEAGYFVPASGAQGVG